MGIRLAPEDVAFRCNLVMLSGSPELIMEDFTAGHISSAEAKVLIKDIMAGIGSDEFLFYPGVGYRHLMVWKGGEPDVIATPPHDISGKAIIQYLPTGPGSERIRGLIRASQGILLDHPVNKERRNRGLRPATSIWLWGQGRAPRIPKITERFHIQGGMISAVDLLNGIGVYAGLEILPVAGATGYIDTNYRGKAEKALEALRDFDFVFVHVEAPDEMGHQGNLEGKIKAIEDFDDQLVGTALRGMEGLAPFRIAVLSDHPTPISVKTHVVDPSPVAVLSSEERENQRRGFTFGEREAIRANNLITPGHLFMETFIGDWSRFIEKNAR